MTSAVCLLFDYAEALADITISLPNPKIWYTEDELGKGSSRDGRVTRVLSSVALGACIFHWPILGFRNNPRFSLPSPLSSRIRVIRQAPVSSNKSSGKPILVFILAHKANQIRAAERCKLHTLLFQCVSMCVKQSDASFQQQQIQWNCIISKMHSTNYSILFVFQNLKTYQTNATPLRNG